MNADKGLDVAPQRIPSISVSIGRRPFAFFALLAVDRCGLPLPASKEARKKSAPTETAKRSPSWWMQDRAILRMNPETVWEIP